MRVYHFVVMIPIIAVFTKYDLLVTHFLREDPAKFKPDAETKASESFGHSVKELQGEWGKLPTNPESGKSPTDIPISCMKVSTKAKRSSAKHSCI